MPLGRFRSQPSDSSQPSAPLLGYKRAVLTVSFRSGGRLRHARPVAARFRALNHSVFYAPDDEARCAILADFHSPPADDCACGFYALKDRETVVASRFAGARFRTQPGTTAVLEVQLYGDVVEGSKGFRASCQQVLAVEVNSACYLCKAQTTSPRLEVGPLVAEPDGEVSTYALRALCDSCANPAAPSVSFSELASLLGVDVVFGEPVPSAENYPYPLLSGPPPSPVHTRASIRFLTFAWISWFLLMAASHILFSGSAFVFGLVSGVWAGLMLYWYGQLHATADRRLGLGAWLVGGVLGAALAPYYLTLLTVFDAMP